MLKLRPRLKQFYTSYKMFTYPYRERLSNYRREKDKFYRKKGYPLNLNNPQSYCEKVVWKKLNDRNPLLPITADKINVRNYISEMLGSDIASQVLIPLLHVTDDPETIPFNTFPDNYIIKANNASGRNIVVHEFENNNSRDIIKTCKKWLERPYGVFHSEWAYQKIEPKILIEKLILDKQNQLPADYKFFVFHGKCKMIYIAYDRFSETGLKISCFTPDWDFLDVSFHNKQGKPQDKPPQLKEMIELAELLAQPFDFVRVDLYSTGENIYFGELTHYPSSGRTKISPVEFDFQLGSYWQVKPDYWLEYNLPLINK